MMELNDKQRQAAESTFGTAGVIAIPGSGKTLTMAARIGNLVQSGIPPEKILGLTFTRNAAGAMRDKLRPVLLDQSSRVTLSTIHSFCHRLRLEFPVVFVIGMIEGVMPNSNGDSEEERRIAFVAMSRAMKLLYLSHSMSYLGRGARPSSFIAEAFHGKEMVEK